MKKMIAAAFAAMGLIAAVGAFAPADADPIAVADKYVVADEGGVSVWEESNGAEGLQTEATDQDGDGTAETPADTQLA